MSDYAPGEHPKDLPGYLWINEPGPCWHCGAETHYTEVNYATFLCPGACTEAKDREVMARVKELLGGGKRMKPIDFIRLGRMIQVQCCSCHWPLIGGDLTSGAYCNFEDQCPHWGQSIHQHRWCRHCDARWIEVFGINSEE